MDRLSAVEEALKTAMLSIKSSDPLGSGYVFYNTVTTVNIEDEAIINDRGSLPAITIVQDPDDTVLNGEMNAFRDRVGFKLKCYVECAEDEEFPKYAINKSMNTIWSDIKAALSADYTLGCTVDLVTIKRARREYLKSQDVQRAANLIVYIDIVYSQSRLNPDLNVVF